MPPEMIALTLPDGSVREVARGTTALDIAASIGAGLKKAAIGAAIDNNLIDLRQPLDHDGALRIITKRDEEAGIFIRHSAEHVLADAVKRLWPDAEYDAGRQDHSEKFQYDFRFPRAFSPDDLEKIEAKMREILKEKSEFERIEVSRDEAAEIFRELGENLKLERLEDIPEGETITLYRHGQFTDLCRGPHVQNLTQVGAVKLLDTGGAYFRGDEANEMLQRIYGTAYGSKKEMAEYLERLEQARARDHRRLGGDLDLYSFHPEAPASPFFHPRGAVIYNELVDFVRELHLDYGFEEVITPQILDVDLWHQSGHYENYRENMYFTEVDERQYAVKPMNCPTHCLIYKTQLRSYRDLPVRYADFGRLHRYERSGVVTGLTRVRTFCQDDAHVYCTDDQVPEEIRRLVELIHKVYATFGFADVEIELSTRPEKRVGSDELWDRAEAALKDALESEGIDYRLNPGDGAFYGPKIDFHIKDAIGRSWQLGTIQLDYQMPGRFELGYIAGDGDEHQPVMIHRAMLGSLERFMGILIEQFAGALPLWLAPVQAVVLPISEKVADYAEQVNRALRGKRLRCQLDARNEKLGYRIREAQLAKIPYMIVVGAQEAEAGTLSVRRRKGEEMKGVNLDTFVEHVKPLIASRSLEI